MTENKLPEGVGKKIVEALKKQSEIEVTPIVEQDTDEQGIQNLISEEVDNMFSEEEETMQQRHQQENLNFQNSQTMSQQPYVSEPIYHEPVRQYEQDIPYVMTQQAYREPQPVYNDYNLDNSYNEAPQASYQQAKEFTIPANVAVLKRLIAQLPQGVSKQTGAQIIRQTMEALGISMSTVLTEAQNFQDGLNTSVRDCVSTIQEYKNNIKNLEKQVSDYQKQSAQVNDLISLFIMTDK